MRIAALAHLLQENAPRGATCPGRRGKVFFVSYLYVRVLQSARFGYRQTEMKHNKFKANKLTTAASQGQSQKPQQEYAFSNLPVSGIQGQTEMKHTKLKINKSITAACTKQSLKRQDLKKGFLWGGSDSVDHVAREVLQHGVANRGSYAPYRLLSLATHIC